ncbi:MAG: hypothetical protein FJX35_21460 [Alphaproteobacteria bacterium]|nr:hypothetical protein [Alphaproteobacteria bacterium]
MADGEESRGSNTLLRYVVSVALVLAPGACSTSRETSTQRSGTEQLLISRAVDKPTERLTLDIPEGTRIFVDANNVEGYDSKDAVGALRDRLLKMGCYLMGDRASADTIVELRAGTLATDEDAILLGFPAFEIPVPLAGPVKTPELALFKRADRRGVAELAATGYGVRSGALQSSSNIEIVTSHRTRWVVLLIFSWTTTDIEDGTTADFALAGP